VRVISTTFSFTLPSFVPSSEKVRVVVDVQCSQLWLSVSEPEGFLRALAEATDVPVSNHTPF
jgi:hypothetical protein